MDRNRDLANAIRPPSHASTDPADAAAVPSNDRLLRELLVLHKTSLRLHRLRDPEVLARDVIAILNDVVQYDFAAVYLIDGDSLATFAVSDRGLGSQVLDDDKQYLDSLQLKVGENITGWVAKHGEAVVLADAHQDPRYLAARPGVVSELCVPMRSREQVVGVINLESLRSNAYGEGDRRVLEIVASQIAIAIDNSRMLSRTSDFERLRILSELTGGVAHDLGNLLQVVASSYELMVATLPDELANHEATEHVNVALEKSIDLVRGLLDLGRPRKRESTTTDICRALRDAAPLLKVLAGSNVAVEINTSSVPCVIRASTGQIEQILMNLIVNARQAIADRGELSLSTLALAPDPSSRHRAGHVRLTVRDTGHGMDTATVARAQEPFFTTRPGGTGLGLSTVARIVDELDGHIAIDSTVDAGTALTITLPLLEG